jgi:hypothetical protein
MTNPQDFDESESALPDAFRSAMRSRYGPVPEVPPEIDRAILADARQHLLTNAPIIKRRRFNAWKVAAFASTMATAAVLFLAFSPRSVDGPRESVAQDLDGNGRVDILDAFVMAREIRSGRGQSIHDVNGDGQLDQTDINEIAQKAVML